MLDGISAVKIIKQKFKRMDHEIKIPTHTGRLFKASMTDKGIMVDNLGIQPFLPWVVFEEAVNILGRNGGRARKGNAMNSRLGCEGLSLESVEGHIAYVVYRKQLGESVFRRITPIVAILVWASLCDTVPGELRLR